MLFCSYEFLFVFLPIVLAGYFLIGRFVPAVWPRAWLVLASFVFYAWFKWEYIFIIVASIVVNYVCVYLLERMDWSQRKRLAVMWGGVIFNLGLLGWYKYAMFALANINMAFGTEFFIHKIALPLGISFFTFQQIACLVDLYKSRGERPYSLLNYSLFITFFPQLIAGPIVYHRDMMPQFDLPNGGKPNSLNLAAGLHLFAIGLFKKLVIADFFAAWTGQALATAANAPELTFWQAWLSAFAFLFQVYFDFSAYSDMAMGLGRMFNIRLPLNFDSPLKSCSIQEFWRRWHITLGSFLMNYLYFPLGGSRKGNTRACVNLFIVFLLCGVWHGATWPFVLFGALHGAALVMHRCWNRAGFSMPRVLGWLITFFFVLSGSVATNAQTLADAFRFWRAMFWPSQFNFASVSVITSGDPYPWLYVAGGLVLVLCFPNAAIRNKDFTPTAGRCAATIVLLIASVLHMSRISPFIYFNF